MATKRIIVRDTDAIMVAAGLRREAERNRESAVEAQGEFPGAAGRMRAYALACDRIASALDGRREREGE